jgi:hypothetical protein
MVKQPTTPKRNYNLRSHAELRRIFIEYEFEPNLHEVERRTGIPITTIQHFIKKYQTLERFDAEHTSRTTTSQELLTILRNPLEEQHEEIYKAYAYILAIYLGDGHIAHHPRALRLTIALDEKYPRLIQFCHDTLQKLLPDHQIGRLNRPGCKWVSCYHTQWAELLPQHGEGVKHNRKIELADWQERIVAAYPLEFFRGLYHSDGSRSRNVINGKNYPRYTFANVSVDIRNLFIQTCDRLNLKWKQMNAINIAISRRDDVAWLDEHIGAKA